MMKKRILVFLLTVAMLLTIAPVHAEIVDEEPVLGEQAGEVEILLDEEEVDLGFEDGTVAEEEPSDDTAAVEDAQPAYCYAVVIADAAEYFADVDKTTVAGNLPKDSVLLITEQADGVAKIAFDLEGVVVEGYIDAASIQFMAEEELNGYIDALIAEESVLLYEDNIDYPLGKVKAAAETEAEEPAVEAEEPVVEVEEPAVEAEEPEEPAEEAEEPAEEAEEPAAETEEPVVEAEEPVVEVEEAEIEEIEQAIEEDEEEFIPVEIEEEVTETVEAAGAASKPGTWLKDGGGWWYKHNDGTYTASDWEQIDGKWYYFNAKGYMTTGWQKIGGKWYYLKPGDGYMLSGWQKVGTKWYYLNPGDNAYMFTGWRQIKDLDGKNYWFYFGPANGDDGFMRTGWTKDGKWYYLDGSGHMLNGWQKIGAKWYYLNPGNDGYMVTGWRKVGTKWYYLNPENGGNDGYMITGWKKLKDLDGQDYWFMFGTGDDGYMKLGWQKDTNGKWYYMDNSGHMVTGWQKLKDQGQTNWFYFGPKNGDNGYMHANIKEDIGSETYTFDSNGWLTKADTGVFVYGIKNNLAGVTVEEYKGNDSAVTVPATYSEIAVTEIGADAFTGKALTSIDLPDSIEVIGARAFKDCSNLKSMN